MFKLIKNFFTVLIIFSIMIFGATTSIFADKGDGGFIKIVIIGNYGGGKTSIMNRLLGHQFDDSAERLDNAVLHQKIVELKNGSIVVLQYWDTPGVNKCRDRVINYATNSDFVLIVHDLTQNFSEGQGAANRDYLDKLYRDIKNKIKPTGKIVLLGSKHDLCTSCPVISTENHKFLKSMAEVFEDELILTSAKEDKNIDKIQKYILQTLEGMNFKRLSDVNNTACIENIGDQVDLVQKIDIQDGEIKQKDARIQTQQSTIDRQDGEIKQKDRTICEKATENATLQSENSDLQRRIDAHNKGGFLGIHFGKI